MLEKVQLVDKVNKYTPKSQEDLNIFKVEYLGKKGVLNNLFSSFKDVPIEQKKEFGSSINSFEKLSTRKN